MVERGTFPAPILREGEMTIFFQHVGEAGGRRDFPRTIGTARAGLVYFNFEDIESYLEGVGTDELRRLRRATEEIDENGFQIWGIPSGAKTILRDLKIDDYLLLLEAVGPGGSFAYGGRIIARPSGECFALSRHLWGEGRFPIIVLILLHHKILCRECLAICAEQQGHRGRVLTKAAIRRRRMVAIELGM